MEESRVCGIQKEVLVTLEYYLKVIVGSARYTRVIGAIQQVQAIRVAGLDEDLIINSRLLSRKPTRKGHSNQLSFYSRNARRCVKYLVVILFNSC